MLIAGDVGGTKANLALFTEEGKEIHSSTYPTQKYATFQEIFRQFYKETLSFCTATEIRGAAFALAGPVRDGICKTTNLPWIVEEKVLEKSVSFPVRLLNDLEANAYALEILPPEDVSLLHVGNQNATGNRAVISPGTGLGEAALFFDGKNYHPFACEGGHTEFGPRDELELELCRYLIARFDHVSYERLLSGPGLFNIYQFLRDVKKAKEPLWLKERLGEEDPSKVISEEAIKGTSDICKDSINLFFSILGAEAGNCALKFMATGGLYIGGGIVPKNKTLLEKSPFMESFLNKGRFRSLMETISVSLILNEKASLLGAYVSSLHF